MALVDRHARGPHTVCYYCDRVLDDDAPYCDRCGRSDRLGRCVGPPSKTTHGCIKCQAARKSGKEF